MPLAELIAYLAPDRHTDNWPRSGPYGGLYFRPMVLRKTGDVVRGHKHNYDHVTFLYRGSINVRYTLDNGETGERQYDAPARIEIRAGVIHEITALEDDTAADCIYPLRNSKTGAVTDQWDGKIEAYQ